MKKHIKYILLLFLALFAVACSPAVKVVKTNPQTKELKLKAREHFMQGVFLQQQERYNEALVEFYQSLHYDSASAAIYNAIAENHMKLAHFESAEILLKKSLDYNPDNQEALQLLAACNLRLGRDDQAIELYHKILDKDPYNEEARQYLLLLYEKNGDELNVARQTEEMIELYGSDIRLLERLANIYLKQKKYDKAFHYLDEITKVDSTDAQVLYLMGHIKERQNQQQEAVELFKKVLQIEPTNQSALDRLTYYYRSQRDWDSVISMYQPVLQADSSSGPARVLLAESYYYQKDYDTARKYLLPLVDNPEPELSLVELMGRIEFEAENLQEAQKHFKYILKKDNKNRFAYLFLGFTLSDLDSLEAAEQVFANGISAIPNDATIWSFYGLNLNNQEKYAQAIAAFKRTLDLDSLNSTALTNLPVVYEALKLYAKSDSVYEMGIKRLPENDLLLNNFSYSLSERNLRMQEALDMSLKAVAAQPDNAAYLDTIGWIYFKLGQLESAEKYIKKSIEIRKDSPVVLEHLGDVYDAMGNQQMARTYWQEAYDLDSENEILLKKLENSK